MPTGHADTHDLGKLTRWHEGLHSDDLGPFPVHAIFLVSAEDKSAHNIFRQFRSSFEDRGAGFHHLVIFGQHGVSSTVNGLLAGLGLDPESLPMLVLFTGPSATQIHLLPLPGGGDDDQRWSGVLAMTEQAAEKGEGSLCLDWIKELTSYQIGNRSLVEAVGGVLTALT